MNLSQARQFALIAAVFMPGIARAAEPPAAPPASQPATAIAAYMQAAALLKVDGPSNSASYDDPMDYPPWPPAWHRLAGAAWEQNAPARAMVREATVLAPGKWHVFKPDATGRDPLMPSLNGMRALANDLGDAALYAASTKSQNAALDLCDDIAQLADALRAEPETDGSTVRLLVAIGIDALRADRLMKIAPLLDLSPTAVDPIDCKRLQTSIADLLKQTPGRQQWESLGEVKAARPPVDVPDRIAAQTKAREKQVADGVTLGVDRTNAERTFVAMSLACQLFKADHGRWPNAADELVPAYLPAIPIDPFANPPQPFGYVLEKGAMPDGTDRPMVFHRAQSSDGLRHTDKRPLYNWYVEDGGRATERPAARYLGQFRDVAAWPTTKPAK